MFTPVAPVFGAQFFPSLGGWAYSVGEVGDLRPDRYERHGRPEKFNKDRCFSSRLSTFVHVCSRGFCGQSVVRSRKFAIRYIIQYWKFESHSLRQSLRARCSPSPGRAPRKRNGHRLFRGDLRTFLLARRPEILSLGPIVSEAPHFADLVRNSIEARFCWLS